MVTIKQTTPATAKKKPRSNARQVIDQADRKWAWTVVRTFFGLFVFMTIVWAADQSGLPGLQVILFFITLVLMVAVTVSVKVTTAIFALGSLLGREDGQSLFQAGSEELHSWWTKGAPGAILAILVFQGIFIIFPWGYTFGLYWMAVGIAIIIGICMFVYEIPGTWTPKIVLPIAFGMLILTMVSSMFGIGLMPNVAPIPVDDIPYFGSEGKGKEIPAPPVPVGPMKFQSGITYPADRNFAVLGIIPANGATFAPPIDGGGGCHINIAATDNSLFDIQNIGHAEDPGSKVQITPLNNLPTEAWIRTICN